MLVKSLAIKSYFQNLMMQLSATFSSLTRLLSRKHFCCENVTILCVGFRPKGSGILSLGTINSRTPSRGQNCQTTEIHSASIVQPRLRPVTITSHFYFRNALFYLNGNLPADLCVLLTASYR